MFIATQQMKEISPTIQEPSKNEHPNVFDNATYITYIDESEDVNNGCYIYSALSIPSTSWNVVFKKIKDFRRRLREEHGIDMRKELHARDFVAGRGRFSSIVFKGTRHHIFREYIELIASLRMDGVFVTNSCTPAPEKSFDRIINRISNTMSHHKCYSILIFDAGNENFTVKTLRKMRVFNSIPSMLGSWPSGRYSKNITIDQIIAEASFRDSQADYLIQTVDFIAYSLLRREYPTKSILKYESDKLFIMLQPVLNTDASRSDEFGVARK